MYVVMSEDCQSLAAPKKYGRGACGNVHSTTSHLGLESTRFARVRLLLCMWNLPFTDVPSERLCQAAHTTQPLGECLLARIASLAYRRRRARRSTWVELSVFLSPRIVSANVCTLRPGEFRVNNTKSKSRIQSGLTCRIKELNRQLSDAKVDVVCMQEGRLSLSGEIESNEFSIFRSAAYANGNCGVMVWIKRSLKKYYIAANEISPRLLRITLDIFGLKVHILSGHAPIAAADEFEKNAFWDHLDAELLQ